MSENTLDIMRHLRTSATRLREIMEMGRGAVEGSPELQESMHLHLENVRRGGEMMTGFLLPDMSNVEFDRVWDFLEQQLPNLEGGAQLILDIVDNPDPPKSEEP